MMSSMVMKTTKTSKVLRGDGGESMKNNKNYIVKPSKCEGKSIELPRLQPLLFVMVPQKSG